MEPKGFGEKGAGRDEPMYRFGLQSDRDAYEGYGAGRTVLKVVANLGLSR
jgi:hypothetical protein